MVYILFERLSVWELASVVSRCQEAPQCHADSFWLLVRWFKMLKTKLSETLCQRYGSRGRWMAPEGDGWLQREIDAGANGSFNPDLKGATLQDKR